eukprot:gene1321-11404_t
MSSCFSRFKKFYSTTKTLNSLPNPKYFKLLRYGGVIILIAPPIFKLLFRNEKYLSIFLDVDGTNEKLRLMSVNLLFFIKEGHLNSFIFQNQSIINFLINGLNNEDNLIRKNCLESVKVLLLNDAFVKKFLWFDITPHLLKCLRTNEKDVEEIFELIFKKETNISTMNSYPKLINSLCDGLIQHKDENSQRLLLNSIYFITTNYNFRNEISELNLNLIKKSVESVSLKTKEENEIKKKCEIILEAIDKNSLREIPRNSKESWVSNISKSLLTYRIIGLLATVIYSRIRVKSKFNGNSTIMKDGMQVAILANSILIFDDLFRSIFIESKGARSLYGKSLLLELTNPSKLDVFFSIDEQKMYMFQKSLQLIEWLTILNLWKRSNFILFPIIIFQSLYLLEWELKKYKEIH